MSQKPPNLKRILLFSAISWFFWMGLAIAGALGFFVSILKVFMAGESIYIFGIIASAIVITFAKYKIELD